MIAVVGCGFVGFVGRYYCFWLLVCGLLVCVVIVGCHCWLLVVDCHCYYCCWLLVCGLFVFVVTVAIVVVVVIVAFVGCVCLLDVCSTSSGHNCCRC